MQSQRFRFGPFLLDCGNRRLSRDGAPVELSARYFDALALLAGEQGRLVTKERFLDEVWRGVPVTDEALTQCVRSMRRALGDDAFHPLFIETVPKHGYRFIAEVETVEGSATRESRKSAPATRNVVLIGLAGTIGGGIAGLIGGLIYGFTGAAQPLAPGLGAASVLLVLTAITTLVGLIGGAGVGFGISCSLLLARRWRWAIAGGAAGGLIIGATAKLLGLDAFQLLLGRSPGEITGAMEGLVLGSAVGLGVWLALRNVPPAALRRALPLAALAGGMGGLLVSLLGGRLMAGSLDLLARNMPGSRLRLDRLGALLGEDGFGSISRLVTSALEGALFAACVVGAMVIAWRDLRPRGSKAELS